MASSITIHELVLLASPSAWSQQKQPEVPAGTRCWEAAAVAAVEKFQETLEKVLTNYRFVIKVLYILKHEANNGGLGHGRKRS